jgi:NAD(P)-dependent dehydrogenase (short-subunit alcohol dehydrogenase family)
MAKTVLITGTSSGIGLAAAVAAAQRGWTVVATMRDTLKSQALLAAAEEAGVAERVHVDQLDVTDPDSVQDAVNRAVLTHGGLDAVVNNAGAGTVGTVEQNGMTQVRAAMEVNFFGTVQVTEAALPHLRASGGRLVSVTSVGGAVGQPFNEAYCAAKFAVEGFMEALAPVAATTGVTVCVVEPGAVTSEFVASIGLDIPEAVAQAGPYGPALQNYLGRTGQAYAMAQTSAEAAASVVEALEAEKPAFRIQTSDLARAFVGAKLADLDGSAIQGMTSGWVAPSA